MTNHLSGPAAISRAAPSRSAEFMAPRFGYPEIKSSNSATAPTLLPDRRACGRYPFTRRGYFSRCSKYATSLEQDGGFQHVTSAGARYDQSGVTSHTRGRVAQYLTIVCSKGCLSIAAFTAAMAPGISPPMVARKPAFGVISEMVIDEEISPWVPPRLCADPSAQDRQRSVVRYAQDRINKPVQTEPHKDQKNVVWSCIFPAPF